MPQLMDIAIVSVVRTPIGQYGGALKEIDGQDMATIVIKEATARSGDQTAEVDEVSN